ncbi:MAG: hypothetical protein JJU24_17075 [Natronohydrobacter sp.]|nr:hypothetical protein [Natronohydrobacter sp.]
MNLLIKTAEQKAHETQLAHLAAVTAAIDAHVEAQARAMQYNSAAHLASYVTSTKPVWKSEAEAFVAWRDGVWEAALDMLSAAQQGGPIPSVEDAIAGLPLWGG